MIVNLNIFLNFVIIKYFFFFLNFFRGLCTYLMVRKYKFYSFKNKLECFDSSKCIMLQIGALLLDVLL